MNKQAKKYQTQWASQFYVAAELTRPGHLVSLTLGNAPVADLLVVSPNQKHFMVDVKGLSTKNFWLIKRREPREELFYVLVYLPRNFEPPKFSILSSANLMEEIDKLKIQYISEGKTWDYDMEGINWSSAFEYENRWDVLPE